MNIEELIQENEGTIVDVRTREEFAGGHVVGSTNIPLQELEQHAEVIQTLPQPLILCCASGGRSGMAQTVLSQKGIECYNAGGWTAVNYIKAQQSND
jgi:phage shock protein E